MSTENKNTSQDTLKLSENDYNHKIKILMEKINTIENSMKNERVIRMKLEEENCDLKESLNNFQRQIEEKVIKKLIQDNLFKTVYIEKLNIEKELNMKIDSVIIRIKQDKPETILMLKINGKNKSNDNQSRQEYFKNLYDQEKKKNEIFEKEISKLKKEFDNYKSTEKEKNSVLIQDTHNKESSNFKLKIDIKSLAEANKNAIIELNALNNIIEQLYKQQEIMSIELSFYKNELEIR